MARKQNVRQQPAGNRQMEKHPGRPVGAATSGAVPARSSAPACTLCGRSSLKRHSILSDVRLPTPHTDPSGAAWTHRRIIRCLCDACGTWQPLIEFYNG